MTQPLPPGAPTTQHKKSGRHCLLTPELQQRICNSLQLGAYLEDAARYNNVSVPTVFRWLAQGQKQRRGKFREFRDAIEKAKTIHRIRALALVSEAAKEDYKAAIQQLKWSDPKHFAERQIVKIEVEKQVDVLLDQLEKRLQPAEFRRVVEAIRGAARDSLERGDHEDAPSDAETG